MSRNPNIVNIINFIRATHPHPSMDMVEPVQKQIELVNKHDLPATWLLQYDALISDKFVPLLKNNLDEKHEIGGWFEIVQPLAENAGLQWRGRDNWDWHSNVGFSVGYTPYDRKRMVDVYMADFKRVFGQYPSSVGSWFMDAVTLAHMADEYGIVASCNCKDQWGTDGYNLWGGYYNQAFYPSRMNAFMPAQSQEAQIPVPIFRMLGSDPIYQYDSGLDQLSDTPSNHVQQVITLEPAYKDGGGNPQWVQWFFDVNFNSPSLSFGYTQVGQENSFGWAAMADGLAYQVALLEEKAATGELRVETLADSGRWFRSQYPTTPSASIVALNDWNDMDKKSVWYNSRFYRANLCWEKDVFCIRDIHLFDENYTERYLNDVCTTSSCIYDTLPVLDGYHWSNSEQRAKATLVELHDDYSQEEIHASEPVVSENGNDLTIQFKSQTGHVVTIDCKGKSLRFDISHPGRKVKWALKMAWAQGIETQVKQVDPAAIHYVHNGFDYRITCRNSSFDTYDNTILLRSDNGESAELLFGI